MFGSIGSFNRNCVYCNRPITVRLTWNDLRWRAFERGSGNGHYCLRQNAKRQRVLMEIVKVCALAVILAAACFWLLHQEWWYEIAGLLTSE